MGSSMAAVAVVVVRRRASERRSTRPRGRQKSEHETSLVGADSVTDVCGGVCSGGRSWQSGRRYESSSSGREESSSGEEG